MTLSSTDMPIRVLLLAGALALGACQRAPAPDATAKADTLPPASAASSEVPNVEVIEDVSSPVPAEMAGQTSFDPATYAGSFASTGARLTLAADGNFQLQRGDAQLAGTWNLERDAEHLLLDPESKATPDLRYKMVGNDELQGEGDAPGPLLRAGQ